MRNYQQDFLISLKKVQEVGQWMTKRAGLFENLINQAMGTTSALLFYTSGNNCSA